MWMCKNSKLSHFKTLLKSSRWFRPSRILKNIFPSNLTNSIVCHRNKRFLLKILHVLRKSNPIIHLNKCEFSHKEVAHWENLITWDIVKSDAAKVYHILKSSYKDTHTYLSQLWRIIPIYNWGAFTYQLFTHQGLNIKRKPTTQLLNVNFCLLEPKGDTWIGGLQLRNCSTTPLKWIKTRARDLELR